MMKNIFKRIFCKHSYNYVYCESYYDVIPGPGPYKSTKINLITYRCSKCGKKKKVKY